MDYNWAESDASSPERARAIEMARASTGGFGTGGGRDGAIVALVLGLIGINLGGLALSRSRRFRTG